MNSHAYLHQRFVQLGIQRKNLTRQLQALLPEIYKQEIFKKHNCATIYEYAWKFAGFSKSLVEKIIRTSKHLENKPFLMKAVEKYGVHKVAMVATLATPETDKIFAGHVKNMSKPALFEYTKEIRRNQAGVDVNNRGLFEASASGGEVSMSVPAGSTLGAFPCCAVPEKIKIELDDEMQILFLQLKKNLQKEFKQNFSNKEALKVMLKKMLVDGKTPACPVGGAVSKKSLKCEKMANIKEKMPKQKSVPGNGTKAKSTSPKVTTPVGVPRYIKVYQKREMFEKQAGGQACASGDLIRKCSYPGCNKPQMVIYHRDRFSASQSHDSIIPLCKEHHEFCHNGLIKNETGDPYDWKLNLQPQPNFVDKLTLKYRKI